MPWFLSSIKLSLFLFLSVLSVSYLYSCSFGKISADSLYTHNITFLL